MRRFEAATVCTLLAACGGISVPESGSGQEGESCTRNEDCTESLRCVGNTCVVPDEGDAGGTPDAKPPLPDAKPPLPDADKCGLGPCPLDWVGDGDCDHACNCEATAFDQGDCKNHCRNPNDRPQVVADEFYMVPLGCWQECAASAKAALQDCTAGCVAAKGVGGACAECFAVTVDCVMTSCEGPCAELESTPCYDCAEKHCGPGFRKCAGLEVSEAAAIP